MSLEAFMLYKIQKTDIGQAAKVLADAFQHDPLWNKLFEGEADKRKIFSAFEVPVRYGLKYGEVYAPSEKLEGVIAFLPGKHADMGFWSTLRSGALGAALRMGMKAGQKMGPIFKPVVADRHAHMVGRDFLYVLVVGVATALHGKGFGGQLLRAAIDKASAAGLPLYLETETEENVRMYEHLGFTMLKKITLPVLELPMWEMAREPGAGK
jgi:GNAT superfamily N-acetyltransferase